MFKTNVFRNEEQGMECYVLSLKFSSGIGSRLIKLNLKEKKKQKNLKGRNPHVLLCMFADSTSDKAKPYTSTIS